MDPKPQLTMSGVVLDAPDAAELADFYRRLLGWKLHENEPGWVTLAHFEVDDLRAASAHARAQGAVLAEFQPQDTVRVHLDPAGHPFCLWVRR
jgi:catechol 2,3-dioxygenase-like lactoylglutathione lyase family enzyme